SAVASIYGIRPARRRLQKVLATGLRGAVSNTNGPLRSMNQETDEKVRVRAILDRRPGAFEALVRDYQKLCWHIVYRMVGQDDAPDLCQETFLRVHRLLHQFRFECPL